MKAKVKRNVVSLPHKQPRLKIGDTVTFTINGESYIDTIIYIDKNSIEGLRYDLTYYNLTKVKEIK